MPDAFFKAVLAGKQSIANKSENENMQKCIMSVDRLGELSGMDFFTGLDYHLASQVEATYNLRNGGRKTLIMQRVITFLQTNSKTQS